MLDHVLENEIFIVVTNLINISVDDVVDGSLPSIELVIQIREVINFFLGYIRVQDFLVNSASEC